MSVRNPCGFSIRFPRRPRSAVVLVAALGAILECGGAGASRVGAADLPPGREFTNSLGMRFVRVEPGTVRMGQVQTPLPSEILPLFRGRGRFDILRNGDDDEHPVHEVRISKGFFAGAYEVSNKEYELFDASHAELRGFEKMSLEDDEAVVNVSWYDARAFCRWLSDKEGLPYRLPTEAEWEYFCRAGTETNYWTGVRLPDTFTEGKNARNNGALVPVSLRVGQTPPNPWGIYDTHGNVEEWCHDWYGPYVAGAQVDPVGRRVGDYKVLRGGSWNTPVYFLRSANRMGTLPDDQHGLMGFRVVLGELPRARPMEPPAPELHAQNVLERDAATVAKGPDPEKPYFRGPRKFVRIPTDAMGPLFGNHNHDPAIVECPNGDLLAVWYTCISETNRDLRQAASRLRWGADEWDPASIFWYTPDRNDHAPALWFDGKETIYHFTGVAFAAGHYYNAVLQRTSKDSGATWSRARRIVPDYQRHGRMPSEPVIRLRNGSIALCVDGHGSGLWISKDEGLTWTNPGGRISGIHAGVVELHNGNLLAFGRGEGKLLEKSVSSDGGKTYTYPESRFPPVGGGQRLVLMRLAEGAILLTSFADTGIDITDASGRTRTVHGLYAAVSLDEGKTWPHVRLISDDGPGTPVECTGGGLFAMSSHSAEYRGYLAGCQSADGLIHIISSRQHYAFNYKWATTAAPATEYPQLPVQEVVETFTGPKRFDADGWVDYHGYLGEFTDEGSFRINSLVHHNGIHRLVGHGSFEMNIHIDNITYYPRGERVSEGMAIWLKDAQARSCSVYIKEDQLYVNFRDRKPEASLPDGAAPRAFKFDAERARVKYEKPPKSVKIRYVWDAANLRMRLYYGLNGEDAVNEFAQSSDGIYFGEALSESTALYLLMSNGTIDLDHFEIAARKN